MTPQWVRSDYENNDDDVEDKIEFKTFKIIN